MKNEMIDVLMCVYKEPISIIDKAINSVLNQTYHNIRLICIIDNPIRNDAVDLLREYSQKGYSIVYNVNEKNIGLANSLNIGLALSKAPYIARMDADDIACIDRLEKQLCFLKKYKYDLVGARINYIDENGNKSIRNDYMPHTDVGIKKCIRFSNPVPHPTWLVCRDLYERLSGYRNIDAIEDYDFLLRAFLSEAKIGKMNDKALNYRISLTGITQSKLAYQKLATDFLYSNFKRGIIPSEQDINEYINNSTNKYNKLIEFYDLLKKPNKSVTEHCRLLRYRRFYQEVVERICKKYVYK